MTDSSLLHTTHTAPSIELPADSTAPIADPLRSASHPIETPIADEEDYTIKCICGYSEDDGNTVFCDSCSTWQHVDCYYYKRHPPGVEDLHNCADCGHPWDVDAKRATERQRRRREDRREDSQTDKKLKKPSKSHKKKIRSNELNVAHTIGWLCDSHEIAPSRNGSAGSPKDQAPPAKRTKTNHRSSNSTVSHGFALNSGAHANKRSTFTTHLLHSPTKTSGNYATHGYHSEPYSAEFLRLYEDDPGESPLSANSFNNIQIANDLSLWSHDVDALMEASKGRTAQEIFLRCEQTVDSMPLPSLIKETRTDESKDCDGLHPTWTYLTIGALTPQNAIVGELRGKIGHMQDYVQESGNRWEYLRHPLPFVFFHPYLPIYIDTRKEGNACRYLRRSCTPNLSMKTILENGSDYHFCFMANQDLEPGTELTVGWTLDEHMRTFFQQKSDGIKQEGITDTDESYVTGWVGRVLADYGGCACNGFSECSMAKYDRRHSSFSGDSRIYTSSAKSPQTRKLYPHISAHSTGRTTTSRSGSEALKHPEDDDVDDSGSTSTSIQSKQDSRDLTPPHVSGDRAVATGVEISAREKRKIENLEKAAKQDKSQSGQRKKKEKRMSGGSTTSTPTAISSAQAFHLMRSPYSLEKWDQRPESQYCNSFSQPNTPGFATRSRYADNGTSRACSGSPTSCSPPVPLAQPISHSTAPLLHFPISRSNYVDSSMQTDPDPENDLASGDLQPPLLRVSYMSLTKRLLLRCHKERVRKDDFRTAMLRVQETQDGAGKATEVPTSTQITSEAPNSSVDIVMHDGDDQPVQQVPFGPPLEKLRPPDSFPGIANHAFPTPVSPLKPPPVPQAWSNSQLPDRKPPLNGYRTADLRVQLPPKQLYSGGPATPVIQTPNSMTSDGTSQSPLIHTPASFPPSLATSSTYMPAPSPIKKKLSLSDYMSRKGSSHNIETPITTVQAERSPLAHPSPAGSSPTMTSTVLKASESPINEAQDRSMEISAGIMTPDTKKGGPIAAKMDSA
ncbi:hypothetical protein MMC13_007262 [Lambiella insularis]|nr:hypothetical protein [Lambiella insularis]